MLKTINELKTLSRTMPLINQNEENESMYMGISIPTPDDHCVYTLITQNKDVSALLTNTKTLQIVPATEIRELYNTSLEKLLKQENTECRPLQRVCAGKQVVDLSNIDIKKLMIEMRPFYTSFVVPPTEVKIIEKIQADKLCDELIIVILHIHPDKPLSPDNGTMCFFTYNGRILTMDEFVEILKTPKHYSDEAPVELYLELIKTCRELCDSSYDKRFNYNATEHVYDPENKKMLHVYATKDEETSDNWILSVDMNNKNPHGESHLEFFQTH